MHNDFVEKELELRQKELSNLCYCLCRNFHDGENLYQETCLKVIKNKSKFRQDLPFDKWLYTVCVNTYRDWYRKIKKEKENILEFNNNEDKDYFLQSIPDCNNANHGEYSELYDALSSLPHKYQIVIALKYFKDYSEKEMAEIVRIPVGTVKSRLHKAKLMLKDVLSKV